MICGVDAVPAALLVTIQSQTRCVPVSEPTPDLLSELLRAAAERDEVAFAELYRLTAGKLYAVARRMFGGQADPAAEATQEAFTRIWVNAAQYDPLKGKPIHWMLSIVRHVCLDMRRRGAGLPPSDVALDMVEIATPPQQGAALDLQRCMGRLEAREAHAILLALHYGLSHMELAQRFAMPLGSMKSLLRRALAKLRACLESEALGATSA
jgi:RNA polymerase sigma-70 factor (ECF subfamily)